jgi:hypothetical protein
MIGTTTIEETEADTSETITTATAANITTEGTLSFGPMDILNDTRGALWTSRKSSAT